MIYLARIAGTGPQVRAGLADNLLITFATGAPPDCLAAALALDPVLHNRHIRMGTGDRLQIGGRNYPLSAVGESAQASLEETGHMTLFFDAAARPRHDTAVHLAGTPPSLEELSGDLLIMEALR